MGLLAILSIIVLFLCFEISMGLLLVVRPGKLMAITDRFEWWAVRYIFLLFRTSCGSRLEFENSSGQELPKRFLLVTNHQSLLDIPLIMGLFSDRRMRFVAKWELRKGVPFVSLLLRSQNHALVKRYGDATQAMLELSRYAHTCERTGACPVIFPEGTRSRDGEVGTFHTAGVRKILDETPLPMVVAACEGGWRLSGVKHIFRDLRETRFRIKILYVSPTLAKKKEVLAAIESARSAIIESIAEMRSTGSSGPVVKLCPRRGPARVPRARR